MACTLGLSICAHLQPTRPPEPVRATKSSPRWRAGGATTRPETSGARARGGPASAALGRAPVCGCEGCAATPCRPGPANLAGCTLKASGGQHLSGEQMPGGSEVHILAQAADERCENHQDPCSTEGGNRWANLASSQWKAWASRSSAPRDMNL